MKAKKWLAVVVAAALLLVPMQVALADGLDGQIITGEAAVDYVDPSSVISIIVPTSASLGFTLDPQNLAATQGVGAWDPEKGGSIIPAAVNIVVNESAVPIKASVHFTLQDTSDKPAVLLNKTDDVNTGTDKNMYLSFVPAKEKTTIKADQIDALAAPTFLKGSDDKDVVFTAADLAGVAAANKLANDKADTATFGQYVATADDATLYNQVVIPVHSQVDATTQTTVSAYNDKDAGIGDATSAAVMANKTDGTDLAFALDKASYYILKDADGFSLVYDETTKNDNYDTGSFIISGLINKNADWSGYSASGKKITVKAEYSFETMTKTDFDAAKTAALGASYNSIAAFTVSGVTVTPDTTTVVKGATKDFSATVAGSNMSQDVTWSVTGGNSTDTAISSAGKLSVAADETASSLTVTATSKDDNTKSGTATVTVAEPSATVSGVTVSPDTATVIKGNTKSFSATVAGAHNPAQTVTWSVSGKSSTDTAIDSDGLLTVGADETASSLTVTATSTVDNSKAGTSTVTVSEPAATVSSVSVSPNTTSVIKGNTKSFSATVAGAHNPAQTVTWSVSGKSSTDTAIDSDGLLTVGADETASSLTVTATSTVDNSKAGTSTVTVNDPAPTVSSVTVSPNTATVAKGATQSFSASVAGTHSPAQTVTWSVTGGHAGTSIDSSGVLTVASGESAASLTVTAASTVDNSKSGTATVTLADKALTNGTPLANLTVTKAQCNAGYKFVLNNAGGTHPAGTIASAYWAATATNDVKANLTYVASTGILTLPTSAWDAYPDYSARIQITMSTGEVFTITAFAYDAP